MKTIPLTKGYEAIVDDEDFERLSQLKWHALIAPNTVYASRGAAGVYLRRMHQLVMGATGIDHINGNGLDNRRCNLRIATLSQNAANLRKITSNSGFKGVWRVKPHQKIWRAKIMVAKKSIYLGTYPSPQVAAAVYDAAAIKHFGEFAATNKMLGLLP